jgi:hypothetical protein
MKGLVRLRIGLVVIEVVKGDAALGRGGGSEKRQGER